MVLAKRSYSEDKMTESIDALVRYSTMIAQGQLILTLISRGESRPFSRKVDIEFGLLHDGGRIEELAQDGTAKIPEKQPFYLKLRNNTHQHIFVCVFSVSFDGTVSQSRVGIPAGYIRLESDSEHILGDKREMQSMTPSMLQGSLQDRVVDSSEENLIIVTAETTNRLIQDLGNVFGYNKTNDEWPLPESGKPEFIHDRRCFRSVRKTEELLSLLRAHLFRAERSTSTDTYVHHIPCTIDFMSQSSEQTAASS